MPKRPWITPQQVRAYSETPEVLKRSDAKLSVDISRAEQYIITYTHNKGLEEMAELPEGVRTACILLAEAYAHNAALTSSKVLKSETFDDYSYSADHSDIEVTDLDLAALLDDYVVTAANGTVTMRMRVL